MVTKESVDAAFLFDGDLLAIAKRVERDEEDFLNVAPSTLNMKGKKGLTLLMFAVCNKKYRSMTGLCKAGANPSLEVDRLGTPMQLAALSNDPKILDAMFQGGVGPNETLSDGTPVFFCAVCEGHDAVIDAFLSRNVDVDRRDRVGNTVVHEALFYERFERALRLVQRLKDVDVLNVRGLSIAALTRRFIDKRKDNPEQLAILQEILGIVMLKSGRRTDA